MGNLYKTHGTCLKGLLVEGKITKDGAEEFLEKVHQIDYSDIDGDPKLRSVLERIKAPCWIFTASSREHAKRCMEKVGIADLDWKSIIDTRSCQFETKHSKKSFEVAMAEAGIKNPAACVFFDDSVKNIVAAKEFGWRTVLVGLKDRDSGAPITCDAADVHVSSLHMLPEVLPELFDTVDMRVSAKKSIGFYVRAAKGFLDGVAGKDGVKAEPVRVLAISGLGEAVSIAIAVASGLEKDGIATIQKVETSYPEMGSNGSSHNCARVQIIVHRK